MHFLRLPGADPPSEGNVVTGTIWMRRIDALQGGPDIHEEAPRIATAAFTSCRRKLGPLPEYMGEVRWGFTTAGAWSLA
jgi:hypothetical protein